MGQDTDELYADVLQCNGDNSCVDKNINSGTEIIVLSYGICYLFYIFAYYNKPYFCNINVEDLTEINFFCRTNRCR